MAPYMVVSFVLQLCLARPDAALQFAEAVVNLRFDEDPKYSAYLGLFEPLCGPQPQRPILTDSLKVSAPAVLSSGLCQGLQMSAMPGSARQCCRLPRVRTPCMDLPAPLRSKLMWCQGHLCAKSVHGLAANFSRGPVQAVISLSKPVVASLEVCMSAVMQGLPCAGVLVACTTCGGKAHVCRDAAVVVCVCAQVGQRRTRNQSCRTGLKHGWALCCTGHVPQECSAKRDTAGGGLHVL